MKIWQGYDQKELDAQYRLRPQIGDAYDAWAERWREESAQTRTRLQPHLDLAYGSHPRHRLDLFPAQSSDAGRPLAVFFHGGFWRSRSKADYSYVANGLRSLGGAAAVVNYPLCPDATLPDVVRSARMAVRWLIEHAKDYGPAPGKIYLFGHSAGAHLSAMCFCGEGADDELPEASIGGALISSGLYELEPIRLCFINADIHLDDEQVKRLSPLRLAPKALAGPLLLAYGGAETDEFKWQAAEFAKAMNARGARTQIVEAPGLTHYTLVPQLAHGGTLLLDAFAAALSDDA